MKEDKEIEKILMNDKKYEDFIHSKTEQEFKNILNKKQEKKDITDIKLVPKSLLFSKHTTYSVINKESKTFSFISGIQAEAFLGSDETLREKLLNAQIDYFVCGNNYIKFVKTRV